MGGVFPRLFLFRNSHDDLHGLVLVFQNCTGSFLTTCPVFVCSGVLPTSVCFFHRFRTVQGSKYATFKVDDLRPNTIEVTPIDQWWLFKKAPRDDGKMMSVKEAEELMKKQENFLGPLSLANKVLGTKSLVSAVGGVRR